VNLARKAKSREKEPFMLARKALLVRLLASAWLGTTLFGCASQTAQPAAAPGSSTSGASDSGESSMQPGASSASAKPGGAASASFPKLPLPGGEEPTPEKALPELRIEPLGMHVGGGTNSPEEKAPFHRALERQFPAFLDCYRLADDPWTGGSFGIDIKIPRAGGAPALEQPRTKIHGAGFQDCMVAAFAKAQFDKPKAGPTVISYSIRFVLGKGNGKK
jgi:hypothetical protein